MRNKPFYEGQELRSKRTGWRYRYITWIEGDNARVLCRLLPTRDKLDDREHIGTISKDRLEPVERKDLK
jgi:hypothetical protein